MWKPGKMSETIRQTVALVGQMIEDLTYEALSPLRFQATLVGVCQSPQYKQGGFFVFSNLRPGLYTLRLSGLRMQPQEYTVSVPVQPAILASPPVFDSPPFFEVFPVLNGSPIFDPPGDNELVVSVRNVLAGNHRITFDPMILQKEIRRGAPVLSTGFTAVLTTGLAVGRVSEARLSSVAGLTTGSIVRIVRDRSIRLKFGPYAVLPAAATRIVGRVMRQDAPEIPLSGALVRLTQVNGVNVVFTNVAEADIAGVDIAGTHVILGLEKDVMTRANQQGDYNLYFTGNFLHSVTLEVTLAGYQAETIIAPVSPDQRHNRDIHLIKV
jgi:hypothetical protein